MVGEPGPIATQPLRPAERDGPEPGPGEIRVRVAACGICRTDLHLAEGDLAPRRPLIRRDPRVMDLSSLVSRRIFAWPDRLAEQLETFTETGHIPIEELEEDGKYVIRAELPGVDPAT